MRVYLVHEYMFILTKYMSRISQIYLCDIFCKKHQKNILNKELYSSWILTYINIENILRSSVVLLSLVYKV